MLIQIDVPERLNKFIKHYKIDNNISSLRKVVLECIEKYMIYKYPDSEEEIKGGNKQHGK